MRQRQNANSTLQRQANTAAAVTATPVDYRQVDTLETGTDETRNIDLTIAAKPIQNQIASNVSKPRHSIPATAPLTKFQHAFTRRGTRPTNSSQAA
ncbi:hypothetical protein [Planctomycetes bacterium CA13]|uniref:hypothetical protein n=1 Tax=Novipirellula herctigrandis TaxID=2527986 RepID=UPI0011B36CDD